ncbi:class I SAM-dependent methyltransferase [Ahrensia kielensis]
MNKRNTAPCKKSQSSRLMEQVRFFGAWARSPKTVGAVAPTSSETADLMASYITSPNDLPVLELGPGTGAITKAIFRSGIAERDLYAVEYDVKFCRDLSQRFPQASIIQGDAFNLDETLAHLEGQKFDCVISGLPLLNFTPSMRLKFLQGALGNIPHGRPLVQFSYGIRNPIEVDDASISINRSRWVFNNLPPARVWTYSYKT